MKTLSTHRRQARTGIRGLALIEVLVALLIFSVSALGLMSMHIAMTRSVTAAKNRFTASQLASDIVGQMWADLPHLEQFATQESCANYARCERWKAKVQELLPGGGSDLDVNSQTGSVVVTLMWNSPGSEIRHKYVTAAYVRN